MLVTAVEVSWTCPSNGFELIIGLLRLSASRYHPVLQCELSTFRHSNDRLISRGLWIPLLHGCSILVTEDDAASLRDAGASRLAYVLCF